MLGICCQFLEQKRSKNGTTTYVNVIGERSLQVNRLRRGDYDEDKIRSTYVTNINNLIRIIPCLSRQGFRLFRLSSALFPLSDLVDRSLWDNVDTRKLLKQLGNIIRDHGMRVGTHPGQFCVLSSDSASVVEKSITELELHGWMFDVMELPRTVEFSINIHGGKRGRSSALTHQILALNPSVRSRLTLENDESSYSVTDLIHVYKATGVPIVFDSHHHKFNDGYLTVDEAFEAACATWPQGIVPLQHISNSEPGCGSSRLERRKHSFMIHEVPQCQLLAVRENRIALECEAKGKNVAIIEMSKQFAISM